MATITKNGKPIINTTNGIQEGVTAASHAAKTVDQDTSDSEQTQVVQNMGSDTNGLVAASRLTESELAQAEQAEDARLCTEPTLTVRIPLITKSDRYVDVGVNGVIKRIQRGVTLQLPRSIVEVLEHADII